jgi:hypothetical protein
MLRTGASGASRDPGETCAQLWRPTEKYELPGWAK